MKNILQPEEGVDGYMDEMNKNNVNNMIPEEIPIPDVNGIQAASQSEKSIQVPQDGGYGNINVQGQPGSTNGNANVHGQPNQPYGNVNQPYGQPNQPYGNVNQPYGQPNQPYGNSNQPYGQSNQPYGQSNQPYGNVNQPYGQSNQSYGQPMIQPYQPRGKKSKALIIAACVIAVVVVLGISVRAYYTSRPIYKIAQGFRNLNAEFGEMKNPLTEKIGLEDIMTMMEEEGSHVNTRLDFTTDTFLGSTTLGIDTELYKDMQAKKLDSSTTVSVMNYEVAHLEIYGTEDVICFSVPELFLEDMYFNTENVVSQYNNSILSDEEMFGEATMEDFSIELFPEDGDRISVGRWRSVSGYTERYDKALAACYENMIAEKAEKGVYRLTFKEQDIERLAQEMLESYEELYADQEILSEYDRLVTSDVSILLAINGKNKIESITLENPVKLLDGTASMDFELFFLGEERSIDTMQGKVTLTNAFGDEMKVVCQIVQTLEDDDYQIDMDMKYSEEEFSGKMKLTMGCDASKDTFDMTLSVKDDEDTLEVTAEGSLDDIVQGESFSLDIDDFRFNMDGEELCKITGNIEVEPLKEEITPGVEAKTAVFEMTYADIADIIYQLSEEYGGIFDLLGY